MLKDKFDVAIIGAGIGGLTCALELVNQGLKVVLLEQHFQVGGCCSSFKRKGFTFDAGAHFIPMIGNKTTALGSFVSENKLAVNLIKINPFEKIVIGHNEYIIPAKLSDLIKYLKHRFPLEKNIYLFEKMIRKSLTEKEQIADNVTFKQILDELFVNKNLKTLLAVYSTFLGTHVEHISAKAMFIMLSIFFGYGLFYPQGGSGIFAESLKKAFMQKGGKLLLAHSVEKIKTNGKRVVKLFVLDKQNNNKKEIKADWFISNINLYNTFFKLIGKDKTESSYLAKIKRLQPSNSCIALYLGLNINSEKLIKYSGLYVDKNDHNAHRPFFITILNSYDNNVSPSNTTIVYAGYSVKLNWYYLYNFPGIKKINEIIMLSKLQKIIPGLKRKDIIVIESAVPATYKKYTKNYKGAIYGWQASCNRWSGENINNKTPYENLFLAGHWTNPGGGVNSVMTSGLNAARKIFKNY